MTESTLSRIFTKINYFKGFFLQAEDLRRAEAYRDHTRWLHNRLFHGPGVVRGFLEELEVVPLERGDGVRVKRGLAIDASGREIFLDEPREAPLRRQDYDLPRTVYVRLRYATREVDQRRNEANVDYSGFAFVEERAELELSASEPAPEGAIELARIALSAQGTRIRPTPAARGAGADEIDLSARPWSGIARATFRLGDYAELVHDDEFLVHAGDNFRRRIAEVTEGERSRLFSVGAYPKSAAEIKWHQEVSVDERGATEYTVVVENISTADVSVRLVVYRLA